MAARTLLAVSGGAVLLALHVNNLSLVLTILIAVLAFDSHNLVSLKNFFLAYIVFVFGVGGAFLHLTKQPIYGDIAAYTMMFLVGYAVASMPRIAGKAPRTEIRRPTGKGRLNLFALEQALLALICVNLLYLAFQFHKYGVLGYYQGAGLLNQALTYGKASASGGVEQIVTSALTYSAIGLIILYVHTCFEQSTPIRYRYPAVLFVALPVLSLRRFDAVVGAMTLLAVFACDKRVGTHQEALSGTNRQPIDTAAASPSLATIRSKKSRTALVILGLVLSITTAVFIASIRGGFASKTGQPASAPDKVAMFTSELSPVQAYGDIRSNLAILGRPHGRTIVLPLLLQGAPRSWYPNKPLNSAAYYMSKVRHDEWAAGLALPPTFWGDLYLNFGFPGALLGSLVLGLLVARLDLGYRQRIPARLPAFLIVFANFYALMRDPLAISLAGILLTLLVWTVANRAFRPGEPVALRDGDGSGIRRDA